MSIFLLALIAAVVSQLLGWVWHTYLFGRQYGNAMGVSDAEMAAMGPKMGMKQMWVPLVLNFVANYVLSFVVFLLMANFGASNYGQSFVTAAVLYVGFALTFITMGTIWNGRSPKGQCKIWLISAGYQLVNFAILALLFTWLV